MNRDEAYQAMLNGEKLTHIYALPGDYIHIKDGVIVDNQGMNIHAMFFYTDFMKDGFSIY